MRQYHNVGKLGGNSGVILFLILKISLYKVANHNFFVLFAYGVQIGGLTGFLILHTRGF